MSRDDLIYLILLVLGIAFGYLYKKIKIAQNKKIIGSLFGLAIILYTSSYHVFHIIFTFAVSTAIILSSQSKCHLICFTFMMVYLLFFRTTHWFGIPTAPGHTNMIQMIMTLKIIGLSFEKNAIYNKIKESKSSDNKEELVLTDADKEILYITPLNAFYYCFNYIGLLTGPYYTYRTFYDYFNLPFAERVDSLKHTIEKLKWVPVILVFYLISTNVWPLNYALSDEFYMDRSMLYRLFYVWPTFFIFRMRIYLGIILSECICTMAGFGAYPKSMESKCGHGPSNLDYNQIKESSADDEYDFETVQNVDVIGVEKCVTFRAAMKHWNRCIQYWLAMYVYKRFPSKKFRTFATMAVSAYWHGVHPGYYFCILGPPFYLPIEDLYTKLFRENRTGLYLQISNVVCWILKFFAFSYMGTAFLLKDIDKIWFYYKSVNHIAYIFWLVLYVAFMLLRKQQIKKLKRQAKLTEADATENVLETK